MENKSTEDYEEVIDLKKPSMGKRKILVIIFLIAIVIIGIVIGYFVVTKSGNKTNNVDKANTLKITTKKIDDDVVTVFANGKAIDFKDGDNTYGVSDIKTIDDIVVFNRLLLDDEIFYAMNKKGQIIYTMRGKIASSDKTIKMTSGRVYRGKYTIKGRDILISSDQLLLADYAACNYLSTDKVKFVDKFSYLGNDKFGSATLESSVTAKDFIEANKIDCTIKLTTKVVGDKTEVYANNAPLSFGKTIIGKDAQIKNVTKVEGIVLFNLSTADVSYLYGVNIYGDLILSTSDKSTDDGVVIKLTGETYRDDFKVEGNDIYITSDNLSQDDEYVACNSASLTKVLFTDKITYLGNDKFSNISLNKSVTAKEYIADKKYTCPVNITTKDAGDDLVTVYANGNKIAFDDVLDTAGVTKITQLKDVALFNKVGYDTSILYIVNGNGGVIFSAGGKNVDDNIKVKLAGEVYRGTYSVDDSIIYITSDNLGQDPEYTACNATGTDKVQYIQKMTYLGDGKFGALTLSSSVTAQQYITSNKIICNN